MISHEEAIAALKAIFPAEIRKQGFIILKNYEVNQRAIRYAKLEDLKEMLGENERLKTSLGFGVALRRSDFDPKKCFQGGKADCFAVSALKVDFDAVAPKQENLPKAAITDADKGEIKKALMAGPVKPTLVIDSGGGLHAYYSLKNPILLNTRANISRVEALNQRIIEHFLPLSLPCIVDRSIKDVSRIMRLPGSINFRYGEPRPVRILEALYD